VMGTKMIEGVHPAPVLEKERRHQLNYRSTSLLWMSSSFPSTFPTIG
jgi:hypothetical protein